MSLEDIPSTAVADAAKAAKDARRAMQLTVLAVVVALVVLAIDHTIKRAIIAEASQVREIFAQFQEATRAIREAAEQDGASGSTANGVADAGSGGVADDAGTRAAPSGNAAGSKPAAAGGKSRTRARP